MVEDPQATRDDLVVEDGTTGNVDSAAMVSHDDDGPLEDNVLAKGNISTDSQVVQFQDSGRSSKAAQV